MVCCTTTAGAFSYSNYILSLISAISIPREEYEMLRRIEEQRFNLWDLINLEGPGQDNPIVPTEETLTPKKPTTIVPQITSGSDLPPTLRSVAGHLTNAGRNNQDVYILLDKPHHKAPEQQGAKLTSDAPIQDVTGIDKPRIKLSLIHI